MNVVLNWRKYSTGGNSGKRNNTPPGSSTNILPDAFDWISIGLNNTLPVSLSTSNRLRH